MLPASFNVPYGRTWSDCIDEEDAPFEALKVPFSLVINGVFLRGNKLSSDIHQRHPIAMWCNGRDLLGRSRRARARTRPETAVMDRTWFQAAGQRFPLQTSIERVYDGSCPSWGFLGMRWQTSKPIKSSCIIKGAFQVTSTP